MNLAQRRHFTGVALIALALLFIALVVLTAGLFPRRADRSDPEPPLHPGPMGPAPSSARSTSR